MSKFIEFHGGKNGLAPGFLLTPAMVTTAMVLIRLAPRMLRLLLGLASLLISRCSGLCGFILRFGVVTRVHLGLILRW